MGELSRREFNQLMLGAAVTSSQILGMSNWAWAQGSSAPTYTTPEESQFMFDPAFGPEHFGQAAIDNEKSNIGLSFIDKNGHLLSPSQLVEMGIDAPKIPQALNNGRFIRNGSNPRFVTEWPYHWFDGDGMLHMVKISNGEASYSNRFVRTKKFANEDRAGKALYSGFNAFPPQEANVAEYVAKATGQSDIERPLYPDISNTDLIAHNKKLYSSCAMVGELYEIDPETLESTPEGTQDFDGQLKHMVAAHSKVDQKGVLHAYGFDLFFEGFDKKVLKLPEGRDNRLHYYQVSADGQKVDYNFVQNKLPRNMHDMAITDQYAILLNQPVEMKGGITFDKTQPSEFVFMDMKNPTADPIVIKAPADSILHTANAYHYEAETEDGTHLMTVLTAMDITNIDGYGGYGPDYKRMLPAFTKWVFDMTAEKFVAKTRIEPENGSLMFTDFPVINEDYLGLDNRYTYMGGLANNHPLFILDKIIKYDAKTNKKKTLFFGSERWGSEFSFVPTHKDGSGLEDEGYLVGYVVYTGDDPKASPSEFWVVNAQTMEVECRLGTPHRVPSGFHGQWFEDSVFS